MRRTTYFSVPALSAVLLLTLAAGLPAMASVTGVGSPVLITGPSPYAAGCDGAPVIGTAYVNAEVEPSIEVNPTNPENMVAAWQQDRWNSGGALGLLSAVSYDGGETWTNVMVPFSRCTGGNAANGGDYQRATDPWVTFSPNGHVYQASLSFNITDRANAILVSKSTDGGSTWTNPVTLKRDTLETFAFNDKETITADPYDARYVYAIWDRLIGPPSEDAGLQARFRAHAARGPTWFSRTTDGGQTWEPARMIYDPGTNNQTIGSQIAVLPNGDLVNVFIEIRTHSNAHRMRGAHIAVQRSTDKGETWSDPIVVNSLLAVGVADPATGLPLRTSGGLPDIAVDPNSGVVYLAWQDGRFSGFQREGIVMTKSTDGGLSWSALAPINQAPSTPAFSPLVHVASDGTLGVTYYDMRNDTPDAVTFLTDHWMIRSTDGGATWSEDHLAGPFDVKTAPFAGGFFLGDYGGLTSAGNTFLTAFATANTGNLANRTDIYFATISP